MPLNHPAAIKAFMFAGNARFTIESVNTGKRFTFKIRRKDQDKPAFVSVLTGPDNESSYTFLGTVFDDGTFRHGRRSIISAEASSAKAFVWFYDHIAANSLPDTVRFRHAGKCGRCARTLTVPESIDSGYGPECINHV